MLLKKKSVEDGHIVVGQFGRVHGIEGFIKVHPFTENPLAILDYQPWYRLEKEKWLEIVLVDKKIHHETVLVRVEGFETREKASLLTNVKIAIPKAVLPKLVENEFYCFELIGMDVLNIHGQPLGTIVDVLPTGANDVLVVEGGERRLIPYLRNNVVKKIEKDKRIMVVDWDDPV